MAKKARGKQAKAQPQRLHFGAVPPQRKTNRTSTAKGRNEPTYNLLTCLACAQARNIDIIAISPLEAQGELGRGGQAVVGQTRVSVDAVLAFKRPNSEGIGTVFSTESTLRRVENVYRDVATEMLALSEPGIRGHAHIIQLQGICWEVHKIRTWFFGRKLRVWPILVMEKAELGDLQCYMATEQGQQLSTSDKMSLCQGLASAIATAHSKGIIHGDIKPQNVLLFSEKGKPVAKLSDFGFSVFASTKSLKLGGTTPWKAPEIEARQEHTLLQAKRTDLFSFGMLCLWVLFRGELSERGKLLPAPPPSSLLKTVSQKIMNVVMGVVKSVLGGDQTSDPGHDLGPDLRYLMAINTLDPSSNTLRNVALDLVDQMGEEERTWKEKLRLLFEKTLVFDEKSRGFGCDFSQIEDLLKEERSIRQADNSAHLSSLECLDPSSFEVSEFLQSLCLSDFRVRAHIFECLCHSFEVERKSKERSTLAFQLAFCNKVGFGTTPDGKQADKYLLIAERLKKTSPNISIPVDALEAAIQRSKEVRRPNSTLLHKMCQSGILLPTNVGIDLLPRRPEEQRKIIDHRREEVRAMEAVLGRTHPAILNLKWSLSTLLMESFGSTESIELLHDMVKSLEQMKPEPQERQQRHRDIVITKGYRFLSLMRIMGPQSAAQLVTLAEKTDKELAYLRDPEGQEHVVRLQVCIALSDLLGAWGRLSESKVYLERAQSGMKAVFGEHHPNTVMLIEKDAQRQIREGNSDEAIATFETAIKRLETLIGADAVPLVAMRAQLISQLMMCGEYVKADEVEKGTPEILKKRMPEFPRPMVLASCTMSMASKRYGEAASTAKRALSGRRLPWPPPADKVTPKETDAIVELLGKDCFSKPYPDPNIFPKDPAILGAQGALIVALQAQAQEEGGNNAKGLRGEANRHLEELLGDINDALGKGNWETLSELEGIDGSAMRRAMDEERIPLLEMVTSLGCSGVRDGMHYKEAISVAKRRGFSKVTALLEEHQNLCAKEAPALNASPKFRDAAELAHWVTGHWMGGILYNTGNPRKDPKGNIDMALKAAVCAKGGRRDDDKADVEISGTCSYDMGDLIVSGEATLSGSINLRVFYKGVNESEGLHQRGYVDLDRHAMGGFYGHSNAGRETSVGTFFFYKDRPSDSSGS
ncbi:hypothetical protein BHE90_007067 [Fusarium euwallaceae]|uniref:Protein kinase domain-containing protein n=1 Tax=Fusarium euwallaceae TaxID=1147111 RepID=A0A430LRV3_9HYPO|nr:hypothetical protein BHE90_007067 [Fusarium euwallaceae]